MNLHRTIALLIFLAASSAQSSLFIEPMGNLRLGRSSQGPTNGSILGLGLGARMGLFIFGESLFIAADGRAGRNSFKSSGGSESTGLNQIQLGIEIGLSLPASPFRFWFGYNFLDALSGEVDQLGSPIDSKYSGQSFRLGGSLQINPPFALFSELEVQKYGELEQNGSTVDLNPTLTAVVLVFGLSIPFSF